MRYLKNAALLFLTTAFTFSAESDQTLKLDLQTDLQMIKEFDDGVKENNIDDMFIRMKFMLTHESPSYKTQFRLRFLPIGYGHSVASGAELSEEGSLSVKETQIAKTQIIRTYIQSKDKNVNFTFGRFGVGDNYGVQFGDYLEEKSGARFMLVPKTINGLELFVGSAKTYRTGLTLEIGDKKFNTGSLRYESTFGSQKSEGAFAKIGWRGNVIDQTKQGNAFYHTVAGGVGYALQKGESVFLEVAAIKMNQEENRRIPVQLGYQMPVSVLVDQIVFEAEYDKEREIPVAGSVHFKSQLDEYFALNFGVYNTGETDEFAKNFEVGMRVSGYLLGNKGWSF